MKNFQPGQKEQLGSNVGVSHVALDDKIIHSAKVRDTLVVIAVGVMVLFLLVGGIVGIRAVNELQKNSDTVAGQTSSIDRNAQAAREAAGAARELGMVNTAVLDRLNQDIVARQTEAGATLAAIIAKIEEGNGQHEALIAAKLDAILAEVVAGGANADALGDELLAQVIESNEKAAENQRLAAEGNALDRAIADTAARMAAEENAASQTRIAELLAKLQQLLDERLPRDICRTCTTTTIPG